MGTTLEAKVRRSERAHDIDLRPYLTKVLTHSPEWSARFLASLDDAEWSVAELTTDGVNGSTDAASAVARLAQIGCVELAIAESVTQDAVDAVVLCPCTSDYAFESVPAVSTGVWQASRFSYAHSELGEMLLRSAVADCFLKVRNSRALTLFHALQQPTDLAGLLSEATETGAELDAAILGAMAHAQVILRCDDDGRIRDDLDPNRRPWEFHDAIFHSLTRLGRTEKGIGGNYRFNGSDLPSPPAVKTHDWHGTKIPLPHANISQLMHHDLSLTAALELRRSTRQHSIVPLSRQEIGEFLSRAVRMRSRHHAGDDEFVSRPYPAGGGLYEGEFYLTVEAAQDIPRGFYYYDPVEHALCLVSEPNEDTKGLLDDAWNATAGWGRPQVLITIANRFNRFHWKYQSMSYAAQLKNVGVVYQTMYLVATAMNVGACGLGIGDVGRFARLTGLDPLKEGSVGEFMLGRPL